MTENLGVNDMPDNNNDTSDSYGEYFQRAAAACASGDEVLGMHLYLAAYEKAIADPEVPDGMAVAGLRHAWALACSLKERSMAEYVFEKLEPFLSGEEIASCANELQDMALDRLEEYGFSRDELEGMAEMISQDFLDGDHSVLKVESLALGRTRRMEEPSEDDPTTWAYGQDESCLENEEPTSEVVTEQKDLFAHEVSDEYASDVTDAARADDETHDVSEKQSKRPPHVGMITASTDDFNPYDEYNTSSVGTSYHHATNDGSGAYVFTRDEQRAAEIQAQRETSQEMSEHATHTDAHASNASSDAREDNAHTPVKPAMVSVVPSVPGAMEFMPGRDSADEEQSAPSPDQDESTQPVSSASNASAVPPAPAAPPAPTEPADAAELPAMPQTPEVGEHVFNYRMLAGYSDAIALMREFGVGMQRDADFRNFISMMNSRHGLNRMPALDTLLFRSPVIEDAARFADATIGEINLPVIRMSMEEGLQGIPLLCVTAQGNNRPRMNQAQSKFEGPGILVLEDLDMWMFPQTPDGVDGLAGIVMANMSRGAREAMNMIRSAVENPDVFVLATATTQGEVDPFFYELLEPISIIDIGLPHEEDRRMIWREIMRDHPSTRQLDAETLVRFSAGLPRFDVYMAARAAIEDAYKSGLAERSYHPVTMQVMLEKLAGCQPLDSDEYRALEDEIVQSFAKGLDNLDELTG